MRSMQYTSIVSSSASKPKSSLRSASDIWSRFVSYTALACAALVCVSASLSFTTDAHGAARVAPPANTTVFRGTLNRDIPGNFGWRFGSNKNRDGLVIRVPFHKNGLLFRVQGYDIEGGEVSVFVNGKKFGNLLVGDKKAFNQTELWWIPPQLQRRNGNIIRLYQNRRGSTWGARRLGVFVAGSQKAQFGALRKIDGDNSNLDQVRVIIPEGTNANELQVRYYGLNSDNELRLYVAGREMRRPAGTGKDRWSNHRKIVFPANRRIVIDFFHYENSRRSGASTTPHPWGVRLVGLNVREPQTVSSSSSSGSSTSSSSSSGSSTSSSSSSGSSTSSSGSSGSSTSSSGSSGSSTSSSGSTTDGSSTGGSSTGGTTDGSSTDGSGSGGTTDGSSTDGSGSGGTTDGSSTDGSGSGGTTDGSSTDGSSSGGNSAGSMLGLPTVNGTTWDRTAVTKVLHAFAYGGHPTDWQIQTWADMNPRDAIRQMLTMNDYNPRLSPRSADDRDNPTNTKHTLADLSALWSSNRGDNRTPPNRRIEHRLGIHQLQHVWFKSITVRGLNPFRSKIALWETNYHMAVNKDAGVYGTQLARHYDDVVAGLVRNEPYEKIIARAARSAAVAEQYKHKYNVWENGRCECNEDFGREFHQLYFGILGKANPYYHETVTIKNTAKMLTDMRLDWRQDEVAYSSEVAFGTSRHHTANLEILNQQVSGRTAREKIDSLASKAINHYESLDYLPVFIISGLADDRLSTAKKNMLRQAWKLMPQKNLLEFIHAYAISTLFHDKNRVKYLTSLDRHSLISTRIMLNNEEVHSEFYDPIELGTRAENYLIFAPRHNVFGGQTGIEAARSTEVFRNNYNLRTQDFTRFAQSRPSRNGITTDKNWAQMVPKSSDGSYRVRDVGAWLWNYIIGDGLKNFGDLERAQTYAFLSGDMSLQQLLNANDPERVILSQEIRNNASIQQLVNKMGNQTMDLQSPNIGQKSIAQRRVGGAFNFIAATPFIFAQEGR